MKKLLFIFVAAIFALSSCQSEKKEVATMGNPFFTEWNTPFGVPPFDQIKTEHFLPAVMEGIQKHEKEICGSPIFHFSFR